MFEYRIPSPKCVPEISNWQEYDGFTDGKFYYVRSKTKIKELSKYLAKTEEVEEVGEVDDSYTKSELMKDYSAEIVREIAEEYGIKAKDKNKEQLASAIVRAQKEFD